MSWNRGNGARRHLAEDDAASTGEETFAIQVDLAPIENSGAYSKTKIISSMAALTIMGGAAVDLLL